MEVQQVLRVVMCCVVFLSLAHPMGGLGFAAAAEEFSYKNQGKRDPFIPLITPAGYLLNLEPEEDTRINLEGIMYDAKGDSMAIINGELLKVGESSGSIVVANIEAGKVTVLKDSEKIELQLRREE